MATNLIDMFKNTIGDLLIKQASGLLGETAEHTSSALNTLLPVLMGALLQKGNTESGARGLMDFMREQNLDGSMLTHVTSMLGDPRQTESLMADGTGILKYLLGDSLSAVVDKISGGNGLRTSSATSLVKLAAPLLMHVVGKYIGEKSIDGLGLKNLLMGHREVVAQSLPAGMTDMLGLGSLLEPAAPITPSASPVTTSPGGTTPPTGLSKILPWIVLLLASLGLFYFVQKGCGTGSGDAKDETEIQQDPAKTPTASDTLKTDTL